MIVSQSKTVCFDCRISFKGLGTCPECKKDMINIGTKVRAPKRRDVRGWKKLRTYLINLNPYYKNLLDK